MATFPTFSREVEWDIVEEYEDSTIESPYESGYTHTRPRFTKDRKTWSSVVYMHLTVADKTLLTNFMATVRMGATSFDWVNPDDSVTYVVRFKPAPKITYMATGNYYKAEMGFKEA